MEIAPPVTCVLSPALTAKRPPELILPLPTMRLIVPAAPSDAEPERNNMKPLPPIFDVPTVKFKLLETAPSFSPPFPVLILKAPLDFVLPKPEISEIDPPVMCVLSPACAATRPPTVNVPLPTTTLTLPGAPAVAFPERKVIMPLPLLLVVPDVKDKAAETPLTPELAVLTLNAPLDVDLP